MTSVNSYLSSLFSLEGKTAIITGGTRGIGQQLALALGQAGADIVLVQRNSTNKETYDKVIAAGRKAWIVECDLADKAAISKLADKVTNELGITIDILVNCGGIQRRTPAENFPDNDWDEVLQVNLNTVFTLCRDFGRHMLSSRGGVAPDNVPSATPNPRGNGKIINIASLVGHQGGLTVPAYAAAKHGVLGITKAFSNEWSSKGVNVNTISPGYISTDMNTALINNPTRARQILERIPQGRWGTPEDFEGAVVYLASRASDYVSGEDLLVDGGWMGR
ncbi:NAD-binding protein [Cylindrobasidium torrendii FP15055 ss-10]|uniref:NAD-binding protein n=1 Tax=Cylindrobasidium torrendii FP15055 ss-10 TaxID=1314674 RepID=A0A0D7BA99_9AGAR|nr:NAD-binding protein [Cylindrobasidium torrendii FP15055 ss-10]